MNSTNSLDHAVERELVSRLLALDFSAFLQVVTQLLSKLGYDDVELTGRADWIGRHRDGGCDLTATQPVPAGKRRVIVQAKQYPADRPVFRRTVDELRGVCLRAGASEAVLITTGSFSPMLHPARLASVPIAPVRLIDGEQLADTMIQHQIGAWMEPPGSPTEPARFGVDERFFAELQSKRRPAPRPDRRPALDLELSLRWHPQPASATHKASAETRTCA